jgi:hypothetical protein
MSIMSSRAKRSALSTGKSREGPGSEETATNFDTGSGGGAFVSAPGTAAADVEEAGEEGRAVFVAAAGVCASCAGPEQAIAPTAARHAAANSDGPDVSNEKAREKPERECVMASLFRPGSRAF